MDFKNTYLVVSAINDLERRFLYLKRNNSNIRHKCLFDLIPFNCHCVESVCIAHNNTGISLSPSPTILLVRISFPTSGNNSQQIAQYVRFSQR